MTHGRHLKSTSFNISVSVSPSSVAEMSKWQFHCVMLIMICFIVAHFAKLLERACY